MFTHLVVFQGKPRNLMIFLSSLMLESGDENKADGQTEIKRGKRFSSESRVTRF